MRKSNFLFLLDEEILKNMRFLTGFGQLYSKDQRKTHSVIYILKAPVEAYLKIYNIYMYDYLFL